MSDPYVIRFDSKGYSANYADPGPGVLFSVERADEKFYVGCLMSGTAAMGLRDLHPAFLEAVLIAAGLEELERRLQAGIYPPEDGDVDNILFTSDQYDHLRATAQREKHCVWQERSRRGWICAATVEGSRKWTTAALCAGCVVPDERTLCVHFMHPLIRLEGVTGGGLARNPAGAPFCNIGNDPGDGSRCQLGGLSCARRTVDVSPAFPTPPPDVARRAADEVDYLALVYRDRYDSRLWSIPQARTISEFFGDCEYAEDFQRRLAALADLLAHLNPYEQLDEGERVDTAGKRVGPLVAFERLMARDYPEAVPSVRTLRAIAKTRNAFPIHSRSEQLLAAFRELDIAFPPTDWRLAWLQVLTALWSALQEIRSAIQTVATAEEDSS